MALYSIFYIRYFNYNGIPMNNWILLKDQLPPFDKPILIVYDEGAIDIATYSENTSWDHSWKEGENGIEVTSEEGSAITFGGGDWSATFPAPEFKAYCTSYDISPAIPDPEYYPDVKPIYITHWMPLPDPPK